MKVGILIGHNKFTGARSHNGVDEWSWCRLIALALLAYLKLHGIDSQIFERDKSLGYRAAMRKHARDIKAAGCTHAIELHFNFFKAFHPANGFEFLYIWYSRKSRQLAQLQAKHFGLAFPTIKPRKGMWFIGWVAGAKMLWARSWNKNKADQQRGGYLCHVTHCPITIAEPGFASNVKEWAKLEKNHVKIAHAYGDAFIELNNLLK